MPGIAPYPLLTFLPKRMEGVFVPRAGLEPAQPSLAKGF